MRREGLDNSVLYSGFVFMFGTPLQRKNEYLPSRHYRPSILDETIFIKEIGKTGYRGETSSADMESATRLFSHKDYRSLNPHIKRETRKPVANILPFCLRMHR